MSLSVLVLVNYFHRGGQRKKSTKSSHYTCHTPPSIINEVTLLFIIWLKYWCVVVSQDPVARLYRLQMRQEKVTWLLWICIYAINPRYNCNNNAYIFCVITTTHSYKKLVKPLSEFWLQVFDQRNKFSFFIKWQPVEPEWSLNHSCVSQALQSLPSSIHDTFVFMHSCNHGFGILSSCRQDDQNLVSQFHANQLVSDTEQMGACCKSVASGGNGKPYIRHCANEHITPLCALWTHACTSHSISIKCVCDHSRRRILSHFVICK